jgi:biopolymer transport protein ExbD
VEVVIQVDGTLIIDGQRWDRQITLEQALANALSQHPQALIMVLPDPNAPSQSMLNVLSASGALGQTRVLFSGVERVEP